jgi:predicted transcriptional regulator
MTGTEAIKNYITYASHPFTSLQIVAELGICYETVKKYLQELIKSEYIKQIGKDKGINVYVFNKSKQINIFKSKGKKYTIESIEEAYRRKLRQIREEMDLI